MLTKSILAFLFGGALCLIAQILIDKTSFTPAKILVSYVVFGVFLGAVEVYPILFDVFGAGASVPLIGYGGNIAAGVREAVERHGFFGAIEGAVMASGAGLSASVFSAFITSILFKAKSKRLGRAR